MKSVKGIMFMFKKWTKYDSRIQVFKPKYRKINKN